MKIKSGFMLREIAGSWIVVPLGERVVEFRGMMNLNESGAFLWSRLEKGAEVDELVSAVTSEYQVDEKTAREDVTEFIDSVAAKGVLE